MSGDARALRALADAILEHRLVGVTGGTATGSRWICACSAQEINPGTRDHAEAMHAQHVATRVARKAELARWRRRDEFSAERRDAIVEALSWWEDSEGRWGYEKAEDQLRAHEVEWCGEMEGPGPRESEVER